MSTRAEALWDKGYFVIVSLVDNDMDPKAQLMNKLINYTSDRV